MIGRKKHVEIALLSKPTQNKQTNKTKVFFFKKNLKKLENQISIIRSCTDDTKKFKFQRMYIFFVSNFYKIIESHSAIIDTILLRKLFKK
jgi:hypothetical protein